MLISLFGSQSNPPPQVQVPQIPAAILGSLVNQESKPAEGWGTDCSPKHILTQSAASVAGLSQPSALASCRAPEPGVPLARPEPPSLPVPAARLLLAGAAPAWTEVPGWVPRCPRRGPLVVLLQILHILGLLDGDTDLHRGLGPGQSLFAELGHGWQGPRAARPGQPAARDSDDRAWAARARRRLGPREGTGVAIRPAPHGGYRPEHWRRDDSPAFHRPVPG